MDSETISQTAPAVHLTPKRGFFDDGQPRLPACWTDHNALWALADGELTFVQLLEAAEVAKHLAGARTRKLIRECRKYFTEHAVIPPFTAREERLLLAIADKGVDIQADALTPTVRAFLKAMANTRDPKL